MNITYHVDDITKKLFDNALTTWGEESQLGQVQEECAELIVAINKYKRQLPVDVIDEIADVFIMCVQAARIFGDDEVNKRIHHKLNRLDASLKERVCS